jgi:hypothetical protein
MWSKTMSKIIYKIIFCVLFGYGRELFSEEISESGYQYYMRLLKEAQGREGVHELDHAMERSKQVAFDKWPVSEPFSEEVDLSKAVLAAVKDFGVVEDHRVTARKQDNIIRFHFVLEDSKLGIDITIFETVAEAQARAFSYLINAHDLRYYTIMLEPDNMENLVGISYNKDSGVMVLRNFHILINRTTTKEQKDESAAKGEIARLNLPSFMKTDSLMGLIYEKIISESKEEE